MKCLLPILILCFTWFSAIADKRNKTTFVYKNAVDSIQNRNDLIKFVKRFHPSYPETWMDTSGYGAFFNDCMKKSVYYKIDINNDGQTDLLESAQLFAIFHSKGNNYFDEYFLGGCSAHGKFHMVLTGIDTTSAWPLIFVERSYEGNCGIPFLFSIRWSMPIIPF